MQNFKFIVFKIKSIFLPALICLFILFLLIFSNTNLSAAKVGLNLWANSVLPSLLPFFIATELLGYTNIVHFLGKLLNKLMRPIFNVPGEGAFALLMGIISGYPVGAKIVSNLKNQKICSNVEAERLIAFTNNSRSFIHCWNYWNRIFFQSFYWLSFTIYPYSCMLNSWISI